MIKIIQDTKDLGKLEEPNLFVKNVLLANFLTILKLHRHLEYLKFMIITTTIYINNNEIKYSKE